MPTVRQPTDWLLNCMQYSASGEADSSLANQQTLHILWNPKVHPVCSSLPHVPPLCQISPIHVCHPVSWRSVLMLSTLLYLGLPNGLAIWVFKTKVMHKSVLSCCYALNRLWEPLSLLDFVATGFYFIWLCRSDIYRGFVCEDWLHHNICVPCPVQRNLVWPLNVGGHAVAQWLRHCAINRKVAGSIPDGVIGISPWHNFFGHTMALSLTQPLK
jgi:hypothetical protein